MSIPQPHQYPAGRTTGTPPAAELSLPVGGTFTLFAHAILHSAEARHDHVR